MTTLSFHDLAEQFCLVAGTPLPEITPDRDGVLAFTARLRDVDVTVTHEPVGNPAHAFVLVAYGPLPKGRELEASRQLLHSNLLMLHAQSPAFSLNPIDGVVLLQCAYPLDEASGIGLLAGMNTFVDSALQWREGFFLDLETTAAPPSLAMACNNFA